MRRNSRMAPARRRKRPGISVLRSDLGPAARTLEVVVVIAVAFVRMSLDHATRPKRR